MSRKHSVIAKLAFVGALASCASELESESPDETIGETLAELKQAHGPAPSRRRHKHRPKHDCSNPPDVEPEPPPPKKLTVAVYLPRVVETCFIGDPCAPDADDCIGLRDDGNALVESFSEASMRAVRTSSELRATAQKEVCVALQMTDEQEAAISAELDKFREFVRSASQDAIQLEIRKVTFDHVDMDESRWGIGVYIAPWDLEAFVLPKLDFVPDFNLVVPPIRDPEKQLHHDLGACGLAFGADSGIRGAGWSWIPRVGGSFWFECAEQQVFTHEWLHQVHFGYHSISRFPDLYDWNLPMCMAGDPDPKKWFPDTHQCNEDPDFERCGLDDCGGNDLVDEHILSQHWDPSFAFVANYCKDGRQDFDELGVDTGGRCGDQNGGPAQASVNVQAAALPTPSTTPLPTRQP